ncbi:hypothetical protein EYE42_08345 [Paracoccus subflavus]|uniref:Peptidase S8/S53 domain-containing protein n=1 Tax=Paracoccus subflavus TaxID=2528244 RepID=A0A4Q9FZZ8_9RHOB|nr:hypothetical protein [Paracoccus subflavus]TBN40396.1 hypothetical protein EYE42_08345 [Paracoccus subflavus]
MALAHAIVTAFSEFLEDPAGILSQDAPNPRQRDLTDDPDDARLAYLPEDALPSPESGCIIGVIDDAIPFVHQSLTVTGKLSRVAAVWMQDAKFRKDVGIDLPTGAEWRGVELSGLLNSGLDDDAIYRRTGAVDMTRPGIPSGAFQHGHGASVTTLAAGFPPDDPAARNHPLIAVSLPPRIIADSTGVVATVPILEGILFILNRARRLCRFIETRRKPNAAVVRLPVVINISLGLTAGPRDGSTPLERFMDAVSEHGVPGLGPVHFVFPVGNHRQARLRARLRPGETIAWRLPPDDPTINAVEIWGPPRTPGASGPGPVLQVTLKPPGMAPATTAFTVPWQYSILSDPGGKAVARAYYQPHLTRDGQWRDGIVVIALPTCPERLGEPFAPPGEWKIAIPRNAPAGIYDLSAQRDEVIRGYRGGARQSWFYDPAYRSHDPAGWPILTDAENGGRPKVIRTDTVNAYATGERPLRAGAAYGRSGRTTPYVGLLKTGLPGDCLAAVDRSPTDGGMIVRGRDSGSFGLASGTSLAGPQLARWLAEVLAGNASPLDRAAIVTRANTVFGPGQDGPVAGRDTRFPEY